MMQKTLSKIKVFVSSDYGLALVIAIGWQIGMCVVGFIIDHSLYQLKNQQNIGQTGSFLSSMSHWDAGWYISIIRDWYQHDGASAVFYPLFPLAVSVLHTITLGSLGYLTSALLINTFSLSAAIYYLRKISQHLVGNKNSWLIVVLFTCSPAAIFLHLFYSESLFVAIGFSAYWFALQKRWLTMSILLAFLSANRITAILFIVLCGITYLEAKDWSLKKLLSRDTLKLLFIPVGFVFYALYLQVVRGDALAMFHGYKLTHDWDYQVFNPNVLYTFLKNAHTAALALIGKLPLDANILVNQLLPVMALIILLASSVYVLFVLKRKGIALTVFGLCSFMMFTLNSNVVSVHRYVLPCVVVYIAAALFLTKTKFTKTLVYPIVYGGVILQTLLYVLFVNGYFAG